jgi:hypothetical protein
MLSDNKQAEVYAFVMQAINDVEMLLNAVETALLEEDWEIVKSLGQNLAKAKEVLEP